MLIKHIKFTNGEEVIGEIKLQTDKTMTLSNTMRIQIMNTGEGGNFFQVMSPWTIQSVDEDLREIVVRKETVLGAYTPSDKIKEEYTEQLKYREENRSQSEGLSEEQLDLLFSNPKGNA